MNGNLLAGEHHGHVSEVNTMSFTYDPDWMIERTEQECSQFFQQVHRALTTTWLLFERANLKAKLCIIQERIRFALMNAKETGNGFHDIELEATREEFRSEALRLSHIVDQMENDFQSYEFPADN